MKKIFILTAAVAAFTFGFNAPALCLEKSSGTPPYKTGPQWRSARSPFGAHPAVVVPPFEYGLDNPFDAAADIGIKWDRSRSFIWSVIRRDPEKEEYDWGDERFFRDAPDGINLLCNIFIGSPDPLLAGEDARRYNFFARPGSFMPLDENAYIRFVKALVERYDGDGAGDSPNLRFRVGYWQVDNEPPHGLKDYARFLKITYRAVKEADPGAKVLIGGVPGMPPAGDYIENFDRNYLPILKEISASGEKSFDIFDFHWYGDASGDYLGDEKVYRHITRRMSELGISFDETWMTEMGTYSGDPVPAPFAGILRDYPFQSEKQQAADIFKRYIHALSIGIKKIFTTGIAEGFKYDEGYFDFTGLVFDGKYGHDGGKGVKKLAYHTMKKMIELLEGSDWDGIVKVTENEGVFVYSVMRENRRLWIAWNDGPKNKKAVIEGVEAARVRVTKMVPELSKASGGRAIFESCVRPVASGRITIDLDDVPVVVTGE